MSRIGFAVAATLAMIACSAESGESRRVELGDTGVSFLVPASYDISKSEGVDFSFFVFRDGDNVVFDVYVGNFPDLSSGLWETPDFSGNECREGPFQGKVQVECLADLSGQTTFPQSILVWAVRGSSESLKTVREIFATVEFENPKQ